MLHGARPDLHVGVMVEEPFQELYAGNPAVNQVLNPTLGWASAFGAQLCLNLHGGTRSMWLTAASAAPWRAGFGHYRGQWIYNVRIPRAQAILGEERTVHTAEHVASAMFFLGVPKGEIPRARLFAAAPPARAPYAVIHPFASGPEKTWPAGRFVETAKRIAADHALEPVFIGAANDNWAPFGGFACVRGAPLGELKSLLSGASLFLGNDSGPAHMAAAFGLPAVVIFGPSDEKVWAPWRTQAQVLKGREAATEVPLDAVLAAMARLRVKA